MSKNAELNWDHFLLAVLLPVNNHFFPQRDVQSKPLSQLQQLIKCLWKPFGKLLYIINFSRVCGICLWCGLWATVLLNVKTSLEFKDHVLWMTFDHK